MKRVSGLRLSKRSAPQVIVHYPRAAPDQVWQQRCHDGGMYNDRHHAGIALAAELDAFAGADDAVVLGLTRGGVPVAAAVAAALRAPLDIVVVRKLGVPGQRELAMGAIAAVAGTVELVQNAAIMSALADRGVGADFTDTVARERAKLERRAADFRGDRPPLEIAGRTVILVDDGVATGASVRAAVAAVRALEPERVVVAVPVCLPSALGVLCESADEVICPWLPPSFMSVGQAYRRFDQTSDEEVRSNLQES